MKKKKKKLITIHLYTNKLSARTPFVYLAVRAFEYIFIFVQAIREFNANITTMPSSGEYVITFFIFHINI